MLTRCAYVSLLTAMVVVGPQLSVSLAAPPPGEDSAQLLLNAGRRAHNDAKYDVAADRFREFLKIHPQHADAPAAQHGLGLALMQLPQKDYDAIAAAFRQAIAAPGFPDRPLAMYFLACAQRSQADQALAQARAKPHEAAQLQAAASARLDEAAKGFAAAAAAFSERATTRPAGAAGEASLDAEWTARSRCDQVELLLRLGQHKEAMQIATAMLDAPWAVNSRYRPLAMYHAGYAAFAAGDHVLAGRHLAKLAPFGQEFGVHARYLLARVHHLAGERPEAAAQYRTLLADHEQRLKSAREALQRPETLKADVRAAHEALANGPPPDYIPRSIFHLGVLNCEQGRFSEALDVLGGLLRQYPKFALAAEAQLRQGFCHVQLRNFSEAIKSLEPLRDHPALADQAMLWMARAQVGAADANNPQAYEQSLRSACELLRTAANLLKVAKGDDARLRRGDVLLELADTHQLARQYKEAATIWEQVINENLNPARNEEAMPRLATALHMAGQYVQSDQVCQKFLGAYPKSILAPEVLFRSAENAYLSAVTAPPKANAEAGLAEAVKRYERLIEKHPEFRMINHARHGLGSAHYQSGRYPQAMAVLAAIPDAERNGELAQVSYLLADCLLRTLPAEADDAVAAATLIDQATQAARLLEAFINTAAKSPLVGDAQAKLGHCFGRIGSLLVVPAERKLVLTSAREAYDKAIQQAGKGEAPPLAVLERAKCLALLGETGAAVNDLRRFLSPPLRDTAVAPMAILRLGTLLRSQNKAAEAATMLGQWRTAQESQLAADPARADWVPMLQYEHGLALKESGKPAEARAVFDALAAKFTGRPEASNAVWRSAQCRREELASLLAAATAAKPQERPAAIDEAIRQVRQAADAMLSQAQELGRTAPKSEAYLRLLYDVTWCLRTVGMAEIEGSRVKLARQAAEQARQRLGGKGALPVFAPETIPLGQVPVQPAEQRAREQYQRLIDAAPQSALAQRARMELAEMVAMRLEQDKAADLLVAALEQDPPRELIEAIKLRLASICLARNDPKAALALAQPIARDAAAPLAAEARFLTGESFLLLKEYARAIEQLVVFRDDAKLRELGAVADRALLRLGQAHGLLNQWEPSRQTLEVLLQRFPASEWADEARFGVGWAWENQKQHDNAVAAYAQVAGRSAGEVGARAQLHIGKCRMEQKRYADAVKALLAVPYTYDYGEWSAAAWCEAARAYVEMKQPGEAANACRRVLQQHPASRWAAVAREQLSQIK